MLWTLFSSSFVEVGLEVEIGRPTQRFFKCTCDSRPGLASSGMRIVMNRRDPPAQWYAKKLLHRLGCLSLTLCFCSLYDARGGYVRDGAYVAACRGVCCVYVGCFVHMHACMLFAVLLFVPFCLGRSSFLFLCSRRCACSCLSSLAFFSSLACFAAFLLSRLARLPFPFPYR